MNYHWVKVRAERHHKTSYKAGDVIVVNDKEMAAFGDKFKSADASATPEAMELMWTFELRAGDVEGTGVNGRILKNDVKAVLSPAQLARLEGEEEDGTES